MNNRETADSSAMEPIGAIEPPEKDQGALDTGLPPSPHGKHRIPYHQGEPVWVFGYGSLMWNPGFRYVDRRDAVLHGYHRRFCIYSYRYRGTPEAPGLVLGLDRGGSCRGVAFKIAAEDQPLALQYLWDREMVSGVYRPVNVALRTVGGVSGEKFTAATFVVDRDHSQYCPELSIETAAELIATRHGQNGPNADYLLNTVEHLTQAGIRRSELHRLARHVRARLPAGAR